MSPGQAGPVWSGPGLEGNWDVIWHYLWMHVQFTVTSVALGVVVALPLAYVAYRWRHVYPPLLVLTNVVYATPSLAMFVLLFPLLGITNNKPIVVAMALYSLVILVRALVEGLRAVPQATITAATAMGYGPLRRFATVELPLAIPNIVAGVRLATVNTVALISVGGLIGRGALGRLFSDGFARRIETEVWAAIVAIVSLALVADLLILAVGRLLTPWTRVRARR